MSSTTLQIQPSCLLLSSDDFDLLEGIEGALSFRDASKAYRGGKFNKDYITTVHFAKFLKGDELDLGQPNLKIPIGFLDFVESVLEDFPHEVVDTRKPIKEVEIEDVENLEGIELNEHQLGAIVTALSRRRGIVRAPTASGKTEIFLAMLNMLEEPTLVLFNRKQLAKQTVERAKERGLEVGLVQGENVEEKNITVASIQSIHKIEKMRKYKNLILDEVHNVASKSYMKVLKLPHWDRVYGFSATPVNPKKMNLKSAKIIANVGPIIFDASAKDMMDKGIIAKPTIYIVPIEQPVDIEDFNFREAEMAGIIHNKFRNKVIVSLAEQHREDGVLILNKYVEQGKEIAKLIPEAPFIWHETPLQERLKIVKQFDEGRIKILIASRILDEGIDIKNFKVLIIASAGLSFVKTIQRLGRGLRVTEDKKTVTVYDFLDNTNPKLTKHSKAREKTYKMFGYDDIIKMEKDSNAYLRLSLS